MDTTDALNLDDNLSFNCSGAPCLVDKVAKRNCSYDDLGKEDAYIVDTSGTTGKPKGVVHTHGEIETQIKDIVEAWGYKKVITSYTFAKSPWHCKQIIVSYTWAERLNL